MSNEHVILLHGLWCSTGSMFRMEKELDNAGFITHNVGYPSTSQSIVTLATFAIEPVIKECEDAGATTIHFVTHSMGGILVRYYLKNKKRPPALGRTVMLVPPNKGSEIVDIWRILPGLRWIFDAVMGPAAGELGTGANCTPNTLGPADFPLGIIAGYFDGKVPAMNTHLEGMIDHIVLPYTHTFIASKHRAIRQTIFFLQNGKFDRSE